MKTPSQRRLAWLTENSYAHRGLFNAASGMPENSLAAVLAAMAAGVGSEIDVRLSRDGQVVVFHDPGLERMCGRVGLIADFTAAELQTFALGGSDQCIPTLDAVLAAVRGRVPLLIEVKSGWMQRPGSLERAVANLLRRYDGPVAVLAFNPFSLGWFRRHAPGLPRCQVAMTVDPWGRVGRARKWALRVLHTLRWSRPDCIAYRVEDLPAPLTLRARAEGVPVIAWTVRDKKTKELAQQYADSMIWEPF